MKLLRPLTAASLLLLVASSTAFAQFKYGTPNTTEDGRIHIILECGSQLNWSGLGGPFDFNIREENYDPESRCSLTVTGNAGSTIEAPNHRDHNVKSRTINVRGARNATIKCEGRRQDCTFDIMPIGAEAFHPNGDHSWVKVLQCGNSIVWGTSPRLHSKSYGAWSKRWHHAVDSTRHANAHQHTVYDQNSSRGIYTVIAKKGGCDLTVTIPTPGQAPVVVAPGSAFTFDTRGLDYFTITCASTANASRCEFIVLARFAQ